MDVSMQDTQNQLVDNRELLNALIKSLQVGNRKLAKAEHDYRLAYAKECIKIKIDGAEGEKGKTDPVAWTMTPTIARGNKEVASCRYERDIMQGEVEAIMQKIYAVKLEINILQKELEAITYGQ